NGLISVALGRREGDALVLDTWLMSCRVLKRGIEVLLLNEMAAAARALGLSRLIGEYIPTAKNALVAEHYAGLGFVRANPMNRVTTNATRWELSLADWSPRPTHIEVASADGQTA